MAYTINLTNGTTFATITDGTVNTASSMTLIGKNYAGYGQFLDDNFIHLLENSANATAPPAPLTGQLWWDSTNTLLNIHSLYSVIQKTCGIQSFRILYQKGILLKNDDTDYYDYFKILKEFQSKNRSLKKLSILGRTLLLEHSAKISLNPKRIERLLDNEEINFFDGSFETI